MVRLLMSRGVAHHGEILFEKFFEPMVLSQQELARGMGSPSERGAVSR
jgi:plasmid maintenance system antidote protein VapI